jgi:TolB-like protein/DNA-binding winged helix-turn-helix (wHTH) protein/Tfp pilus assembly protein PilF
LAVTAPERPMLRFGVFELDLSSQELRKGGVLINLPPQPFKILALLASRPGQLVTRDEIQRQVWGEETFVDFEQGLNFAIKKIRVALCDDAQTPRYIETLPRRGYRFIASVETGTGSTSTHPVPQSNGLRSDGALASHEGQFGEATTPVESTPADRIATVGRTTQPAGRRKAYLTAFAVTVVVSIAALLAVLNPGRLRDRVLGKATPNPIQSVAVLPLENLSGDSEQEYFADGMTAELITELAKIRSLRVISRTSAMCYKRTRKPLPQIARELNVDAVVEGEVLRSHGRVRVTAQLIQTATDRHLWAETYERDLRDVLQLQGELAQRIVSVVRTKVTPEEHARLAEKGPVNPEAYEAYLRGRHFLARRTAEGMNKAVEYFQQAILRDPQYAQAYAGLAATYDVLGTYEVLPPDKIFPLVKQAADRALQIDGTLAEAYAARALALSTYERNWVAAEQDFQRAIKLNPNYATAHHWYAEQLIGLGQAGRAIAELKRARELDPLSLPINSTLGRVYYDARRYEEAIEQCTKTLELDPHFSMAHWCLGQCYLAGRRYREAIDELELANTLGTTPLIISDLGCAYAASGHVAKAKAILQTLEQKTHSSYVSPYLIAVIHCALGEKGKAFGWLERAYDERDSRLSYLLVDSRMDPLRSDPRFQDLLRRAGFPQ